MTLGETIARLRRERGLTQAQLAEAVSVHKRGIIRVEQGSTSMTVDVVSRVADALGIQLSELFHIVELDEKKRIADASDADERL